MRAKTYQQSSMLAAEVVLCCQYKSDYYDFKELKATVQGAVDAANDHEEDVEIHFTALDQSHKSGDIPNEIKAALQRASVVILEISDLNPNVLFELGAAWSADKEMIVLREESVKDQSLPFNLSSLRWASYRSDRLEKLETSLSKNVVQLIRSLDLDQLVQDSTQAFLRRYIRTITTTEELTHELQDQFERCERNFYYVGSAGIVPSKDESFEMYRSNLEGISTHRIVNLKSLLALQESNKSLRRKELINHCVWLARYYSLVRDGIINLWHSEAIGQSQRSISLLVFDEEEATVIFGRMELKFNHKAMLIANEAAARQAFDYCRGLVAIADEIEAQDMPQFFALTKPLTEIPPQIAETANQDTESLWRACQDYIESQLN